MTNRFLLDPAHGKLMGVCAGLSRSSGIDLTYARVGAVIALLLFPPVALVAYFAAGLIAPKG